MVLESRFSSFSSFSFASCGNFSFLIFFLYSAISAEVPSFSPSSFSIAFSCSRKKYSFWFSSTCSRTFMAIFFSTPKMEISLFKIAHSAVARSNTSNSDSNFCLSSNFIITLDAIKSLRRDTSSVASTLSSISGASLPDRVKYSSYSSLKLRWYASRSAGSTFSSNTSFSAISQTK